MILAVLHETVAESTSSIAAVLTQLGSDQVLFRG